MSATDKRENMQDIIHKTAMATSGKKTSKSQDWFEAKLAVMTPMIKAKWAEFLEYKRTPNKRSLQILRLAEAWLSSLPTSVPMTIGQGSARKSTQPLHVATSEEYNDDIKTALGLTQSRTALLKSVTREVIRDQALEMKG